MSARTTGPVRALAGDLALSVVVAVTSVALLSHGGLGIPAARVRELDLTGVLLAVATAAPLLGWRRWPLGAFSAVGSASIAMALRGDVLWPPVGLAVALYLSASRRGETASWTPVSRSVVGGVLLAYLAVDVTDISVLAHSAMVFAVAWFAGERTRLRRVQLTGLRDRADNAERAAARERDLAVAEERNRIARDLHDSAAHAMNVIAVRAGAARLRNEPDSSMAALTAIEELARQTIADVDQFVGTLRGAPGGDDRVEVPPGLTALDPLLAEHRAAGHRVELTRTGEQPPLAVPIDHGVYRILQEALTNAARYGTGTTEMTVGYAADALDLAVSNTVSAASPGRATGGHGVIGMHERAASLDGELTATAQGDRFLVRARVPYHGRER